MNINNSTGLSVNLVISLCVLLVGVVANFIRIDVGVRSNTESILRSNQASSEALGEVVTSLTAIQKSLQVMHDDSIRAKATMTDRWTRTDQRRYNQGIYVMLLENGVEVKWGDMPPLQ